MIDRLLTTARVGEELSMNPEDVLRLVRAGKLAGVRQVIRGTGERPRIYIKQSSLQKYIAGLPDAKIAAGKEAAPPEKPAKLRHMSKSLREELAAAPKYL